jgi:purine nucleosidase
MPPPPSMTNATPESDADSQMRARLASAKLPARVLIDTDAANEIDDQFALAWALLSPTQLQVEAVYATPFSFAHRQGGRVLQDPRPFNAPDVGMERSFEEIERVHALLGLTDQVPVRRGTPGYLVSPEQPIASDATRDLIARAMATGADAPPLYVLALGCPTNIASALLIEPRIAQRIVVVWTSGYPSHAPQVNHSFNLEQDLVATRVLLASGVPLVYLPGYHVGAQLRLSLPEIERWVQPMGAIGAYLHQLFTHNPLWELQGITSFFAHSWVMWDLICIAWMIEPDWVPSSLVRMPLLDDDKRWLAAPGRPWMREAHAVKRDAIFADFFNKLRQAP